MTKEYWIAAAILACETSRLCYPQQERDQFLEPSKLGNEEHHRMYLLGIFQRNLDYLKRRSEQLECL